MGRAPCCEKVGLKKGQWTPDEDQLLISYVERFGHGNWRILPKQAGLLRCGKSCRLRWINYLRPDIKRGNLTTEEEETIIRLHRALGNRWSAIAAELPGRTDNEIKNVWNTYLKRRAVNSSISNAPETHQLSHQNCNSSKKEPESESESDTSSVATTATVAMASKDSNKEDHAEKCSPIIKDGNADDSSLDSELDEDFWAQVFSPEAVLPMEAGGGFELLAPYNLPALPLSDYAAISGLGGEDEAEQDFWNSVSF